MIPSATDTAATMDSALAADLKELVSTEDFLDYFGIHYDEHLARVYRLHILQRFHNYLERHTHGTPDHAAMGHWLNRAYLDFVNSDAQTEKVFKVFRRHEPQTVCIPVSEIFRR